MPVAKKEKAEEKKMTENIFCVLASLDGIDLNMFKHWEEEASGEGVELMEKEENSCFFRNMRCE